MENSEFGKPVLVGEQHGMILTCVKKSLQENFVVDLEKNVKQEEMQVEKLCNGSITQENKKEKGTFIMFYITCV